MRAAVLDTIPTDGLTIREIELPPPGEGELLIATEACGICGTDLHILEGSSYRPDLPFVLGHEPVGIVEAVGPGVSPEWLGRRVTMTLFEGCGACPLCSGGEERLCPNLVSARGVLGAWGAFAERMVVPSALAIEVPDVLTSPEAATLVDAGATAANAAQALIELDLTIVSVLGGGPLGLLLAEMLRAHGVVATVVEPLEARRRVLAERGHAVVADIAELESNFQAVADCAGVPSVVPSGLALLEPRGLFLVVGYSSVPELDLSVIARRELRLQGVRSGSRRHLSKVLEQAGRKEIGLPPISTWDLGHINEALAALKAGRVAGKAVITNDS